MILLARPRIADAAVVGPEAQGHRTHLRLGVAKVAYGWQFATQQVGGIAERFTRGAGQIVADVEHRWPGLRG